MRSFGDASLLHPKKKKKHHSSASRDLCHGEVIIIHPNHIRTVYIYIFMYRTQCLHKWLLLNKRTRSPEPHSPPRNGMVTPQNLALKSYLQSHIILLMYIYSYILLYYMCIVLYCIISYIIFYFILYYIRLYYITVYYIISYIILYYIRLDYIIIVITINILYIV